MRYDIEQLGEDDDDGTMVDSLTNLSEAVVGHRIISVERRASDPKDYHYTNGSFIITLDNKTQVLMRGISDCCAFTELEQFLLHPERVDHIITGVGTTDGYTTWHIYADMGDVLELSVGWSCGNPFYYGYGFDIKVEPLD